MKRWIAAALLLAAPAWAAPDRGLMLIYDSRNVNSVQLHLKMVEALNRLRDDGHYADAPRFSTKFFMCDLNIPQYKQSLAHMGLAVNKLQLPYLEEVSLAPDQKPLKALWGHHVESVPESLAALDKQLGIASVAVDPEPNLPVNGTQDITLNSGVGLPALSKITQPNPDWTRYNSPEGTFQAFLPGGNYSNAATEGFFELCARGSASVGFFSASSGSVEGVLQRLGTDLLGGEYLRYQLKQTWDKTSNGYPARDMLLAGSHQVYVRIISAGERVYFAMLVGDPYDQEKIQGFFNAFVLNYKMKDVGLSPG